MAKKASKKTTSGKAGKKTTKKSTKKTTKKTVARKATTKKAVAKKTTRKKTRQAVEKLAKKDLDYFRDLLLKKRAELLGDLDLMESDTLRKSRNESSGEVSNMPIHMADVGTDNYEQEFALELLDSERKILREIDFALERIADGSYGICEGTGKLIGRPRLEANPWARYCIEYARMVEQGLIEEGEKVDEYGDSDEEYFDDDDEFFEGDEDEDEDYYADDEDEDEEVEEFLEEDDDDEHMFYE